MVTRIECPRGTIEEFCRKVIDISKMLDAPVEAVFNGVQFLADGEDNINQLKKRWHLASKVRSTGLND